MFQDHFNTKQSHASPFADSGQQRKPSIPKDWRVKAAAALDAAKKITYTKLFQKPVLEKHAPGYHSIVLQSMDLGTISIRLARGEYVSFKDIVRDVNLVRA